MIARALAVAWMTLAMAGCLADARIARLRVELAEDVRHGRDAQADATSARITTTAAQAFGPAAPESVRVRIALAESWAQWERRERALALAHATLRELEQRHGPHDQRVVPALLSLVRIHFRAKDWTETERVLDRISSLCRTVYARADPPADPFGECRGDARYELHRYYLAIGSYEKWYHEYLLMDSLDTVDFGRDSGLSMLTALGRGFAENGAYPEAHWYLQRCVDELRPRYGRRGSTGGKIWVTPSDDVALHVVDGAHSFHSQSPRCLEDLVTLHRKIGDDRRADELSEWQTALWARGPDLENSLVAKVSSADESWHADYLTSSYANDLAFYYAGKGRLEDAVRSYEHAVALIDGARARDGVFAGAYPAELHIDELLGLGMANEELRHFADAELAYRRAADIAQSELHPRHAWRLESVARLARTLDKAGNHTEAEMQWRGYLDLAGRLRGQDHADYAFGVAGLADVLAASNRNAEASTLRDRAASVRSAYARRIETIRELALPDSLRSPPSLAN